LEDNFDNIFYMSYEGLSYSQLM